MRHAIVLAGGGGTRLWPESRVSKPKQFLSLLNGDGESLLQSTLKRLETIVPKDNIHVVTSAAQVDLVKKAAPRFSAKNIISEPQAKNTAAAIGLAAFEILATDPDATLAVLPSDQFIADSDRFSKVAALAFQGAEENKAIVTVGIVPTFPATGYGYLEIEKQRDASGIFVVKRFVEKPDKPKAKEYIEQGHFLWNGGMFFAKAEHIVAELHTHLPNTHNCLSKMTSLGSSQPKTLRDDLYGQCDSVSFDYAIMEKTTAVLTVKGDFGWNDVGSWNAIHDIHSKDSNNNVSLGSSILVDSENNLIKANEGTLIACLGVNDLIVVQSGNSILVTTRAQSQRIKTLVQSIDKSEHKDKL